MNLNIDSGLQDTGGKTGGEGELIMKRVAYATIIGHLGCPLYSYHDTCFTNAKRY